MRHYLSALIEETAPALIVVALGAMSLGCGTEMPSGGVAPLERIAGDIIYGADARVDYKDIIDPRLKLYGDALAATFVQGAMSCAGATCNLITLTPFTTASTATGTHPLCGDVRFRGQKAGTGCSAFLVAPDIFATAGHCICQFAGACSCLEGGVGAPFRAVFGFNTDAGGNTPTSVSSADVYTCTGTPIGALNNSEDWAVFKVDRVVVNRTPLISQHSGPLAHNQLVTYGYDLGLPLKARVDTFVKEDDPALSLFKANADVFTSDSGGVSIDFSTGVAVGITFGIQVPTFVDAADGVGGVCARYFTCGDDGSGCPDTIFTAHTRMTYAAKQGKIPLHSALLASLD